MPFSEPSGCCPRKLLLSTVNRCWFVNRNSIPQYGIHLIKKKKLVVGGYECASFKTLLFRITQNIFMNQFKLKGWTTLLDKLTDKSIGLKLTQLDIAMVL